MARNIRIQCERRTRAGGVLMDMHTGAQGWFNRGEDVVLELGIFAAGVMRTASDISAIDLRVLQGSTLVYEAQVLALAMADTLTTEQWRTGSAALAMILIPGGDTAGLPAGMLTFEIKATESGTASIYASGTLEAVTVTGFVPGTPPSPGPPTSYTKAESDGRYAPTSAASAASAAQSLALALKTYVGAPGTVTGAGKYVRAEGGADFTTAEKAVARAEIAAAVAGGSTTLSGDIVDVGPGGEAFYQTMPDYTSVRKVVFTPEGNEEITINAPTLSIGVQYVLKIQQGFPVNWAEVWALPPNEISCHDNTEGGEVETDFPTRSWHPETGEGYDTFTVVYDGAKAHVSRLRRALVPEAIIDYDVQQPYTTINGTPAVTAWKDRASGLAVTLVGGSGVIDWTTLTETTYRAAGFGDSKACNFALRGLDVSRGFAIAMVFETTAATAGKLLFSLPPLGVQASMQSTGIRFQGNDTGSTGGLLVSNEHGKPFAAVIVVRPSSAGAFVLTTSDGAGGQTGSFTPALSSGAAGAFGGAVSGAPGAAGLFLECKIARFQVFPFGLTPDQARAVLDLLTSQFKLGVP